jgi:uncharacterized protein YfaS (alpha-2-macroglobulin family)
MAELVYTGRFDLNPARNTREKLLLPLKDIKPLQQSGVYRGHEPGGHYNYSNAATLFTLSDIGLSAHRYHNRLDIFHPESGKRCGAVRRHRHAAERQRADAGRGEQRCDGHAKLETDKEAALILARKDGQTTLLDLKLPALDLAEFDIAGVRATASSSLCLARAISIARVKR